MVIAIISLILLYYLKRPMGLITISPEWNRIFNGGMVAAGVLLAIISLHITFISDLARIVSFVLIGLIVYVTLKTEDLQHRKGMIYAWLPIIGIEVIQALVEIISESFYKNYETYFEAAGFFAFIWAIAMWINNSKQRKALELEKLKSMQREKEFQITEALKTQLERQVAQRTKELTNQKNELQHALQDLQAAQNQLIHAEKMASLGELTAGIAHEIQNPLNFVNNFSDVSTELLTELKEELEAGNKEDAMEILEDVIQNLGKINHHGKRADSIVKGMLIHSRSSTGQKELTDINALADEYLRLSYHGLRAKDKSFTADFKLEEDPSLEKMNVVPGDLGRVLLNLINNGFYAAGEKKKELAKQGNAEFLPKVTVSTNKTNSGVEIRVKDNGNGIPEDIKAKIFQPFFTTKPTGKGTGLGLSMSYDIVTKGHNGEIDVISEPGVFTEFVIKIPNQ